MNYFLAVQPITTWERITAGHDRPVPKSNDTITGPISTNA